MTTFDKLVSIIVPIYNSEKYIAKCVESIINQTYRNIEIILVNDGSKDDSAKICDDWAKKDNRIRVVHKVNGGVSSARNEGIKIAKGEFIQFVDADDYLDFNYTESLVQCVDKNTDLVIAGYTLINEKLEKNIKPFNGFNKIASKDFTIDKFFNLFNQGMLSPVWNKLYKTSIIKNKFLENQKVGEDIIFNLNFLKNTINISISNTYGYYYVFVSNSAIHRKRNDIFEEHLKLIKYFKNYLIEEFNKYDNESYFNWITNVIIATLLQIPNDEFENITQQILSSQEIVEYLKKYRPKCFKDKIKKFLIKKGWFKLLITLVKR